MAAPPAAGTSAAVVDQRGPEAEVGHPVAGTPVGVEASPAVVAVAPAQVVGVADTTNPRSHGIC